jgi:hypothetical protein
VFRLFTADHLEFAFDLESVLRVVGQGLQEKVFEDVKAKPGEKASCMAEFVWFAAPAVSAAAAGQ